jgi:hypothetical protein
MKNLLLILLVFVCNIAFSQTTITQLINVAKMDSESFEIYAMNKGYRFYEYLDKEDAQGISMFQGEYGTEKYLIKYLEFFGKKNSVNYQTANTNELSKLYIELDALGFKLNWKGQRDENFVKEYTRGNESLNIFIKQNWLEIGYNSGK